MLHARQIHNYNAKTAVLTTPPCSDEMLTFRHYIEHSDDLIAFNEKSSTFNPWVTIHAPLVFQNLPGCVLFFCRVA